MPSSGSSRPSTRALVTGATGYLGLALTADLRARGWDVHALTRPASSRERLASILPSDRIHPSAAPPEAISDVVERLRPDVIFHLAATGRIAHGVADIAPMIEANIALGAAVAEAAAASSAALLVAGSYWEYGEAGTGWPNSLYAATKRALDPLLGYYGDRRGLRWTKLALNDIYGPDDWRRRLVTQLIEAAESGSPIDLTEGLQEIEPLHVDDASGAFLHTAEMLVGGRTVAPVGIGGGERVTLRALAALIEAATGRRIDARWGARPYPDGQIFKPAELPRLPSWQPRRTLMEGLEAVVASFRSAQRGDRQKV